MTNSAVFLYDGDCAFCTRSANFLRRHLSTPARVIAWQEADLAALGVTKHDCVSAVQWVAAGRAESGPVAFGSLLRTADRRRDVVWRTLGRLLALRPVQAVAWPVYRAIARNRHRLPGGTPSCALPSARNNQAQSNQSQ